VLHSWSRAPTGSADLPPLRPVERRQTDTRPRWRPFAAASLATIAVVLIVVEAFREPGAGDYRAIDAVQNLDLPFAEPILNALYTITNAGGLVFVWAAFLAGFALTRRWGAAVASGMILIAAGILLLVERTVIDQPRPDPALIHRTLDGGIGPEAPLTSVAVVVLLAGLAFFTSRRLPSWVSVAVGIGSVAVAIAAGVAQVWAGAAWTSDVVVGVAAGAAILPLLIAIERAVGASCDGIPFVHSAVVAADAQRPHTHALTSTILFDRCARTASKIYAPGFVPRAVYWIAYQAAFPYMRNEAALRAAFYRRRLAGLLTECWYGENCVIPILRIDRIDGRNALTSTFVDGTSPRNHAAARAFLFDVANRFDEVGLPTWQVDPRQPRAMSNVLESDDGRFHVIDLESGLVSPLASPRAWGRAFRRGLIPLFDDVFFDLTRAWVTAHTDSISAARGTALLAELRETIDSCEAATIEWHASEPRIWSRLVRGTLSGFGLRTRVARVRELARDSQVTASAWFVRGIDAWERDGRLTGGEADGLRLSVHEPQFVAVLPHFGVHLAIGVVLRFPVGSITRATYTLANLIAAIARFASRRIDRQTWKRLAGIHSPLVVAWAALPGVGTFAYLLSKPVRANHLLVRVALDTALLRLPWRVYERLGLRWLIARPAAAATATRRSVLVPFEPQRVVRAVIAVDVAILAAFALVSAVDYVYEPRVRGWHTLLHLVDPRQRWSLAGWAVAGVLLLCAVLAGTIGLVLRRNAGTFALHWLGIAMLLAVLAVGRGPGGIPGEMTDLGPSRWIMVGGGSAVVAVVYGRFIAALPSVVRLLAAAAVGFLIVGSVAIPWAIDVTSESLLGRAGTLAGAAFTMAALVFASIACFVILRRCATDISISLESCPDRRVIPPSPPDVGRQDSSPLAGTGPGEPHSKSSPTQKQDGAV